MIQRLLAPLRAGLEILSSIAFVCVCAVLVWTMMVRPRQVTLPRAPVAQAQQPRPEPPLPAQPLSLNGAATLGDKTAKIALVVYSDFQCPYCGRFEHDIFPALNTKYVQSGKVLVAFRQFPLSIHPFAQKAAEASECASEQGKFWPMHDQLFEHQTQLDQPNLQAYAKTAGLDGQLFETCLAGRTADAVSRDVQSGRDLAVSGTPTFFVGQVLPDGRVKVVKRLVGARPVTDFQGAIDPLLSGKNSNGL